MHWASIPLLFDKALAKDRPSGAAGRVGPSRAEWGRVL